MKGAIPKSSWLSEIQKAIAKRNLLHIDYQSGYKQEITQREVAPLAVYFTNNSWIVIAYCMLREDTREFRLDRILRLTATHTTFDSFHDFDINTYFKSFQS